MRFALRIPGDTSNAFAAREFQVTPASGAVPPHGKQELRLDFTSCTLGKYKLAMMVDVEEVGPELLALPIVGECIVPNIEADEQPALVVNLEAEVVDPNVPLTTSSVDRGKVTPTPTLPLPLNPNSPPTPA